MSNDPKSFPPAAESQQPELVAYLEEMLVAAHEGRIALFVSSAAVLVNASEKDGRKHGELKVLVCPSLGPLLHDFSPTDVRNGFAVAAKGIAAGTQKLSDAMEEHLAARAEAAKRPPNSRTH